MAGLRQFAAERDALASEFALLPLKASVTGQQVIIDDSSQIAPLESEVIVTQPITVLSNGFCMGGELQLMQDKTQRRFAVKPPFARSAVFPKASVMKGFTLLEALAPRGLVFSFFRGF